MDGTSSNKYQNSQIEYYNAIKPIRQNSRAYQFYLFLPISYRDGALDRTSIDEYMSEESYGDVGIRYINAYKKEQRNIILFERRSNEENIADINSVVIEVDVPKNIRFFAWYIDFTHKIWPRSLTKKVLYSIFLPIGITWFLIGFIPLFIGSYCYKIYHKLGIKKDREYFRQVWQSATESLKTKIIRKEQDHDELNEHSNEPQRIEELPRIENQHNEEEVPGKIPSIPERQFKVGNHRSFSTKPNTSNDNIKDRRDSKYSFSSSESENERLRKKFMEAEKLRKRQPETEEVIPKRELEEQALESRELSETRTNRISINSSRSKNSNRSQLSLFSQTSRLTKDSNDMGYEEAFDDQLELENDILRSIAMENDMIKLLNKREEYSNEKEKAKKALIRLIQIENSIYSDIKTLDEEIDAKELSEYKPFNDKDLSAESGYYIELNKVTERHLATDPDLSPKALEEEIDRYANLEKSPKKSASTKFQKMAASLPLKKENIDSCYKKRANLIYVWDSVHQDAGTIETAYKRNDLYAVHVEQRIAKLKFAQAEIKIASLEQQNRELIELHKFEFDANVYINGTENKSQIKKLHGDYKLAIESQLKPLEEQLSRFKEEATSKIRQQETKVDGLIETCRMTEEGCRRRIEEMTSKINNTDSNITVLETDLDKLRLRRDEKGLNDKIFKKRQKHCEESLNAVAKFKQEKIEYAQVIDIAKMQIETTQNSLITERLELNRLELQVQQEEENIISRLNETKSNITTNFEPKISALGQIFTNTVAITKLKVDYRKEDLAFNEAVIDKLAIQYTKKKVFFFKKQTALFPDHDSLVEINRTANERFPDESQKREKDEFIEKSIERRIAELGLYSTHNPGYYIVKRMEDKAKKLTDLRNAKILPYTQSLEQQQTDFIRLDLNNETIEEPLTCLVAAKRDAKIKNSPQVQEGFIKDGDILYQDLKRIVKTTKENIDRLRYSLLYQQYLLFLNAHIAAVGTAREGIPRRDIGHWFFDPDSAKMIKNMRHMLYKQKCAELLVHFIESGEKSLDVYQTLQDIIKEIKNINMSEQMLHTEISFSDVETEKDLQNRIYAFEGSYNDCYQKIDKLSEQITAKVRGR